MTSEGWREVVIQAVRRADNDNRAQLDLLVQHLVDAENAKQLLRDKGYGVTGQGLFETAKLVPSVAGGDGGDSE